MGVLEDKIITLQQDLIKLKSSQIMGGDNYRVFKEMTTYNSSRGVYIWVFYKSTSEFPLCQWFFEVRENGSIVRPKSGVDPSGNSAGWYYFMYNWGALAKQNNSAPSCGLNDPHNNIILISANIPNGTNCKITVTCKSNQMGVLGIEKGWNL